MTILYILGFLFILRMILDLIFSYTNNKIFSEVSILAGLSFDLLALFAIGYMLFEALIDLLVIGISIT